MLSMIPTMSSFFGLTSLEKGCIIVAVLGLGGGGVASLILGGLGEAWDEIGQGAIFTISPVILLIALMWVDQSLKRALKRNKKVPEFTVTISRLVFLMFIMRYKFSLAKG